MTRKTRVFLTGFLIIYCVMTLTLFHPAFADETPLDWLDDEEQSWLREHPVLNYALDPDFAPFEFIDEEGKAQGLQMDILKLFEEELGVAIAVNNVGNWTSVLSSVSTHKMDMISASRTPEREKKMLFSDVYIEIPTGMIIHKNSTDLQELSDLNGKKIATVKDWSWNEILAEEHPDFILIEYDSVKSALNAVAYKEADAAIMDFGSASYHISINNLTHLKVLEKYDRTDKISFGIRDDYAMLVRILNKTIPRIESRAEAVHNDWIKLDYDEIIETSELIRIAWIVAAVFMAVLLWSLSLRHQVDRKTKALKEELEKSEQMKVEIERINEKLGQSQRELESILNADPSSIFVKDTNGIFQMVNSAAARTMNLEPEEIIGHALREFPDRISPESLEVVERTEQQVLNGEVAYSNYMIDLFDGEGHKFIHDVRKIPIMGSDGKPELILSVSTDITEIQNKNVELEKSLDELKSARAQLLEQEKWAAIGAFVAGIAHDVNTPLGSSITISSHLKKIVANSEKALSQGSLKKSQLIELYEDANESLEMLDRHLNQAADLIQNFKAVSVHQINEVEEEFDLCEYMNRIAIGMKYECKKKGARIEVNCEEVILYKGTPGLISQILTNLIANSLMHGFDSQASGLIRMAARERDGFVHIYYSDNGKGMDENTLKKVFVPFYTTKRSEGGSGLGMHIVHTLVTEKLEGSIDVKSEPDKGVYFDIRLPARQ